VLLKNLHYINTVLSSSNQKSSHIEMKEQSDSKSNLALRKGHTQ